MSAWSKQMSRVWQGFSRPAWPTAGSALPKIRLVPRSLLWRTVLLLALLIAAGHFASLEIFRTAQREPRAIQVAQQIASVVNLTRSALITASPDKRLDLLLDLSQQEGIQVYADAPNEPTEALSDRPFVKLFAEHLRKRLGEDTQLLAARPPSRAMWISFKIDDLDYWVRMPRDRIERSEQLSWVGWAALIFALSVAGAFLIVARINRPLRDLTRGAAELGSGQMPAPIKESGPTEIRTLANAFNQMAANLKRAEEDRALMLAGVSHDLRTPLSRIRLGVEMLDGPDSSLKEGMVQDVEDIDSVIGQFLDFARVNSEELVMSKVDVNELVNGVIQRYSHQGKHVTARLRTLPPATMHAPAIQRVLTNLINNALRHGGDEVTVETAEDHGRARISVLDRGPGIPETEVERMLQPFTRLNSARSTTGSGLGLAIVDRIVKMHNGTIRLLPRADGGLEARVELPL